MRNVSCFLMLSLPVSLLVGCGGDGRPPLVEAKGQVTLNGEPLADAQIFLQRESAEGDNFKRPLQGQTDAAGNFVLGTYGDAEGVPEGTYKVGVLKQEVVSDLPEDFNAEAAPAQPIKYKWITPKKYSDVNQSGLKVEITAEGMQPATIALTSEGAPEIETIGGEAESGP